MDFSKRNFLFGAAGTGLLTILRPGQAQVAFDPAKAGPDGGAVAPVADPYPGGYVVKAPPVPAGEPDVVAVREGKLQGVKSGNVRYFRGVPFAEPPVGSLRFRPPQPAKSWKGVRMAIENPPASMQTSFLAEAPTSEDCLYLNIWAPTRPGPHPVYVYIHGGGNTSGYSLEHRVQGASFARDGIVCVNIGYRLGAFGFIELGGLLGNEFLGSANNGLRDQLLALQWVQRNIAAFGGDPKKVTIGGQSAGGFNVCSLTASPLSRGLFRGAISQSGSGHSISTMEAAHAAADRFAAAIKAAGGQVENLQAMPVDVIMAAQQTSVPTGANNGVIDGRVLLEHPYEAMRKGRGRNVALLFGYNREEMALFGPPPDPASFNPEAKAAFEKYRTLNPGVPEAALAGRAAAERQFGAPTFIYADNHAAAGGTSYVYRWDWAAETGKFKGLAIHGIETPFVWDNIDSLAFRYIVPDPKLRPLAGAAHRLWVSFISEGKPTAAGVPGWPRWTPADRRYLVVADDFHLDRLSSDAMSLWSGLLGA